MMRVTPQRLLLTVSVMLALLGVPGETRAQDKTWEGSFGAGASIPMAELGDEAKTGYHVTGSVGYHPDVLPFGLRLDLFYQSFNAVEREQSIFSVLGGEWFRELGFMLNAVYRFGSGSLRPYGVAGIGYAREWHGDRTYWPEVQWDVDFNAGIGLEFPLRQAIGFVEVRHLDVAGGTPLATRRSSPTIHKNIPFKAIPVTLGVRF